MNAAARLLASHPLLLLACYFLLHMVVRTVLGAPPNLDEAEQFAMADRFAFGYGGHPPLYQWLQTAAFIAFGVNFFAIAFVKNALLLGTWSIIYLLGRKLTGDATLAAAGAFGLLFSANFSWESQIDHTHTVSNTFLVVLATYALFSLLERRSAWLFALLALAIGFGLVAKYNFLLFLAAAVAAFLMDREGRKLVLSPGFAAALLAGAAIAAPHYFYILTNPQEGAAKLTNLAMNRYGFIETRLAGLASFLLAIASVHGVWLAIIAMGWLDARRASRPMVNLIAPHRINATSLFLKLWLANAAVFAALVILGGTTSFRDHWLQPEAVFFPLAAAIWFSQAFDAIAFRRLALAACILALFIPAAVIANKRLFPGAQRDAAMPDPAAIAAAFPDAAAGKIPIVIGETVQRNWYAAGHLRYWLQIPTPLYAKRATTAKTPCLLLAETDTPPQGSTPIGFFRTDVKKQRQSPGWHAVLVVAANQ
jgi:4-amino-4-deoxy-L-arabinose transferase-like glycosyltransferase